MPLPPTNAKASDPGSRIALPRLPIQRRMGASLPAIRRRVAWSPNYRDGQFQAHEPAKWVPTGEAEGGPTGNPVITAIRERGRGRPQGEVPLVRPVHPLQAADLAVTWYGHATLVLEVDGARFLLDPVFGERVSPSAFVGPKRLHPTPGSISSIPAIDAVVISHDHYDHLDEPSIARLELTHKPRYIVPIGVDEHLLSWGVPASRITALDWRDVTEVAGVTITCTEARHFSGRGFARNQTLWAGWAFRGPGHSAFFAGDSGPTHRYENIGADLGPFDLTMIPVGAYSDHWPDIHLNPEQAITAHLDVNQGDASTSAMLPIHWATFNLAMHWWSEPIRWAKRVAAARGVKLMSPVVGTRIVLSDNEIDDVVAEHQSAWWEPIVADGDHD